MIQNRVLDIPTFLQALYSCFQKTGTFSLQLQIWIKVSMSIERVLLNANRSMHLTYWECSYLLFSSFFIVIHFVTLVFLSSQTCSQSLNSLWLHLFVDCKRRLKNEFNICFPLPGCFEFPEKQVEASNICKTVKVYSFRPVQETQRCWELSFKQKCL